MNGKIEVGSQEWMNQRFQERLAYYREWAASPVVGYSQRLLFQARTDRLAEALSAITPFVPSVRFESF